MNETVFDNMLAIPTRRVCSPSVPGANVPASKKFPVFVVRRQDGSSQGVPLEIPMMEGIKMGGSLATTKARCCARCSQVDCDGSHPDLKHGKNRRSNASATHSANTGGSSKTHDTFVKPFVLNLPIG